MGAFTNDVARPGREIVTRTGGHLPSRVLCNFSLGTARKLQFFIFTERRTGSTRIVFRWLIKRDFIGMEREITAYLYFTRGILSRSMGKLRLSNVYRCQIALLKQTSKEGAVRIDIVRGFKGSFVLLALCRRGRGTATHNIAKRLSLAKRSLCNTLPYNGKPENVRQTVYGYLVYTGA